MLNNRCNVFANNLHTHAVGILFLQANGRHQEVTEVVDAIVKSINKTCKCKFQITEGAFQCSNSDSDAVIFRAEINGSKDLLSYIEMWKNTGNQTIKLQSIRVKVDSTCVLTILSYHEAECHLESPINSGFVIFGTVTAVFFLILVIFTVICISRILKRRTRYSTKMQTNVAYRR